MEAKSTRGTVREALPQTHFKVEIEGGKIVHSYLCGRMYKNHIRVIPGDEVVIELSPDGDRGRIVRRL